MSRAGGKANRVIADRIRLYRKQKGLTQHKLALKSGLNLNYVGMIERQEYKPTVAVLEKICNSLGITLEELFKGL